MTGLKQSNRDRLKKKKKRQQQAAGQSNKRKQEEEQTDIETRQGTKSEKAGYCERRTESRTLG